MKAVNPKGDQHWIFIGKTDAKAETPILWSPDAKNWLIGTDPDAWKDWRQEEKGTTEDEMVGWHHWLDVHEFEQAPGTGDGQGSLASCSAWACKGSDTTEWLNFTTGFSQCLIWRVWELWPYPCGILGFCFVLFLFFCTIVCCENIRQQTIQSRYPLLHTPYKQMWWPVN